MKAYLQRARLGQKLLLGATAMVALAPLQSKGGDGYDPSPDNLYKHHLYYSKPRSLLDNVKEDMTGVSSLISGVKQGDNIIRYGNWYGPGWWGGDTDDLDPGDREPIDELDQAAQRHDFGYLVAERMGKIYGKAEELRLKAIADWIAVEDARRLDPDPSKWNPPATDPATASRYRDRIITGFRWESDAYDKASTIASVLSPVDSLALMDHPQKLDYATLKNHVQMHVERWERKTEVAGKIEEANELEEQGDLAGALRKFEEAQELSANDEIASRILELRNRVEEQEEAQALIREGYALEKQGELKRAIGKYEIAQGLVYQEKVASRILLLRNRLQRVQALIREGYAQEKQEDLRGAISKYRVAQSLRPNPKVAARISYLLAKLSAPTQKPEPEGESGLEGTPQPSSGDIPGEWVSEGDDSDYGYPVGHTLVDDSGTEFILTQDGTWKETGEQYEPVTLEQKEEWNQELEEQGQETEPRDPHRMDLNGIYIHYWAPDWFMRLDLSQNGENVSGTVTVQINWDGVSVSKGQIHGTIQGDRLVHEDDSLIIVGNGEALIYTDIKGKRWTLRKQ